MMKKTFILLAAIIFIFACDKESLQNIAPNMSAEIDGETWTSITRTTIASDEGFTVTATSTTGETLILTILGDTAGVYDLNFTAAKCGAVYKETLSQSTSDAYVSSTGIVVITEIDNAENKISGTFEFQLRKDLSTTVVEIKNGVFNNLKFTNLPE